MNLQYRYRNDPRPQRGVEEPPRRSSFTNAKPQDSRVEWREARPPYQNCEDPDGVPLSEMDPELLRKREMLQKLNEKILHTKASIAIKSGGSHGVQMKMCKDGPLRDRVREILLQHQFSLYSKLQSSKERLKSSTMSKERLQQEEHPLKLRVKALRTHRLGHTSVLPTNKEKVSDVPLPPPRQSVTSPVKQESSSSKGFELLLNMLNKGAGPKIKEMVPDVPLPHPRQSVTSPVRQESSSNKGFELLLDVLNKGAGPKIKDLAPDVPLPSPSQSVASPVKEKTAEKGFERFLNMLNKGVDISSLSSNVKEDPEIPVVCVETKSDLFLRGESLPSGSGSLSSSSSTESKAGWLDREESLPKDIEEKTATQGSSLDSGDPSTSSLKVTMKEEEKEDSDLEEKRKQLQSILKSLGLNLNMEELSKLTDRNHERVYGKKRIKKEKGVNKGKNIKKGKNVSKVKGVNKEKGVNKGKNVKKGKNVSKVKGVNKEKSVKKDRSDSKKKQGRCIRSKISHCSSPYLSSSASSYSTSESRSASRSRSAKRSRSLSRSPCRGRSRSRNQRSHSHSRDQRSHSRETSRDETRRRSMMSSQSRGHKDDAFPFPHSADYLYKCAQFINYCNTYSSAINPYWFYQQNENCQLPVSSENYSDPQCSRDDSARRNPSVYPLSYQEFMASWATDKVNIFSGKGRSQCLKVVVGSPSQDSRSCQQRRTRKRSLSESSEKFSEEAKGPSKATSSERKAIPERGRSLNAQRSEEQKTYSHRIDVSHPKEGRRRRSSSERSEDSPMEKKMGPTEVISSKVKSLLAGGRSFDAQPSKEEKPLTEKVGASNRSSGLSGAVKSCLKIKLQTPTPADLEKERKARVEEEIKTRLRTKLLDFTQKAKEMTKRQYPNLNEPADSLASELT